MSAVLSFLVPERTKLLFVAEWLLFSALFLVQVGRREPGVIVNLLLALTFFYVCGCGFARMVRRSRTTHIGIRYLGLAALGLVVLDHTLKAWASSYLPLGESLAIVPGVLSYAHVENAAGSWFFATYGLGSQSTSECVGWWWIILAWWGSRRPT